METNLERYNNTWYKAVVGASKFKQVFWYFTNVIFFINALNVSSSFKVFLLRLFGAKIGNGVVIKPGVNIKYPWKLSVGDYSWIGEKVWIDNLAHVVIHSHVCISQGALLITGNHNFKKPGFDLMIAPIELQNGVWIGARAVVGPGVTAFSHAVLTLNSVASKDMEEYSIYSGNPAYKVRDRILSV